MGYTHYWRTGKRKPGKKNYNAFTADCLKLIEIENASVPLNKSTLLEVESKTCSITINGVGEDAHEDCYFPRTADQLDEFQFCKTARKPYDIVVTAALCILQERCGKLVEVSSDGNAEEWEAGRALAEKVLGRPIKVPAEVKPRAVREQEYWERRAKEQAARG